MTRATIEKEKKQFQPITTTIFLSAKVPPSLSSISVSKKSSLETNDYIIPRVLINGNVSINSMCN